LWHPRSHRVFGIPYFRIPLPVFGNKACASCLIRVRAKLAERFIELRTDGRRHLLHGNFRETVSLQCIVEATSDPKAWVADRAIKIKDQCADVLQHAPTYPPGPCCSLRQGCSCAVEMPGTIPRSLGRQVVRGIAGGSHGVWLRCPL